MANRAAIKVAGAWSGLIEIPDLTSFTVEELRRKISELSGLNIGRLKLICGGRILKDDESTEASRSLKDIGINANSKVLLTLASGSEDIKLVLDKKIRAERLARLKAAAESLSSDFDNVGSSNFHLENQSGESLIFESPDDRKALVMGLMLHSKGRALLEASKVEEASEVLAMAEEAFQLCNAKHLEVVDNVGMLQLDILWCMFLQKDVSHLASARNRVETARKILVRSHGANLERLRIIQGGFCPELSVYVRLELLEGIIAFHSGNTESARLALLSAKEKYTKLQVSDSSLVQLAELGFSTSEAKRALRFSGQNADMAAIFLLEQQEKKQKQRADDTAHDEEKREQRAFGKTPAGNRVDITNLKKMTAIGYEKWLAAEALRQNENDWQKSLEALLDPNSRLTLKLSVWKAGKKERPAVDHAAVASLVSMGWDRTDVIGALEATNNDESEALDLLMSGGFQEVSLLTPHSSQSTRRGIEGVGGVGSIPTVENNILEEFGEPSSSKESKIRDIEMEEEIKEDVRGDPYEEYDVDVEKEGEAIFEYLALVNSHTL